LTLLPRFANFWSQSKVRDFGFRVKDKVTQYRQWNGRGTSKECVKNAAYPTQQKAENIKNDKLRMYTVTRSSYNQPTNELYTREVVNVWHLKWCLHDTTCCTTGRTTSCTTGCIVYTQLNDYKRNRKCKPMNGVGYTESRILREKKLANALTREMQLFQNTANC